MIINVSIYVGPWRLNKTIVPVIRFQSWTPVFWQCLNERKPRTANEMCFKTFISIISTTFRCGFALHTIYVAIPLNKCVPGLVGGRGRGFRWDNFSTGKKCTSHHPGAARVEEWIVVGFQFWFSFHGVT